MSFTEILFDPTQAYIRQALLAAAAVGAVCALMSVVVVLKRMAFLGQGISHAGFGGWGTAVLLGLGGATQDAVMLGFCLATALAVGAIVRTRRLEADAAIGILLVAGMAWGVLMANLRVALQGWAWYRQTFGGLGYSVGWESLLFGSPLAVGPTGMWAAVAMAAVVIAICAAFYKELLFYAFDETASRVFGVPTAAMHYLLMVLLALVVVVSMRLVGFILVSALLVIPGAAALQVSDRMGRVLASATAMGLLGSVGGVLVSVAVPQLSPGACIVMLLVGMFLLTAAGRKVARLLRRR